MTRGSFSAARPSDPYGARLCDQRVCGHAHTRWMLRDRLLNGVCRTIADPACAVARARARRGTARACLCGVCTREHVWSKADAVVQSLAGTHVKKSGLSSKVALQPTALGSTRKCMFERHFEQQSSWNDHRNEGCVGRTGEAAIKDLVGFPLLL